MKRTAILTTAVAIILATPGFALAQGYGNEGNRDHDNHADHNDHERGAGPKHAYHRGDRLPPEEHRQEYVVNDWHARHLREPPRGEHWVRSGDDYVLAAVATGVITDLVLNSH